MIRKGYIDTPSGQLHYREFGAGDTSVVFLHQTASSSAMWIKVMLALGASRRLIAVDTPGFGGSFDPSIVPTMEDYVRWTLDAMTGAGIKAAHLVGHHTGAAIAVALARAAPSRVLSLSVIGISLLNAEQRRVMAGKLGRPFKPSLSGAYLLQNWEYLRVGGAGADIHLLHREMSDILRAWASRPHAYAAVWAQDSLNIIQELGAPLQLMAAPDDMMFTSFDLARRLRPDADAVVLPNGANFEPDLAPEAIAEALNRHLKRVESLSAR